MFLSHMLTAIEKNYWPTELEVTGLVWAVKKIQYIIKAAIRTIVYIDHISTISITKQTSLNIVSIKKLNLRLVRASKYL